MQMLSLLCDLPVYAHKGGWFVSRGIGIHPDRCLETAELIFVRSGTLSIQEEEQAFEVMTGQTLLLLPGRRHFGTRPYAADLSFYWLHFTLCPVNGSLVIAVPQYTTLPRPDDAAELFRRLLNGQKAGTLSSQTTDLLLLLLLSEVAAADRGRDTTSPSSVTTQALAFIRTQFHRPISAADVAEYVGYNPDYLGRIFREIQGRTLNEAIEELRLLQARRLLLDSNSNIDAVARASGFTDANYFRRRFKHREGVSPGAFRRLHSRADINTE